MKRQEDYPLQKVTLNLRAGDWEWLTIMYGREGPSRVIRNLVIEHVESTTRKITERICLDEGLMPPQD